MKGWLAKRRSLTCEQVVGLVTDYLEGALKPGLRRRFEAHLTRCLACPEYVRQIQAVASLAGRPAPGAPAPPSRDEALALFVRLRGDGLENGPQP